MRRIRHLEQCDYVVPIGQRLGTVLTLSNNVYLDRTWDNALAPSYKLEIAAKFNSSAMQGLTVQVSLQSAYRKASVKVSAIRLYRVSNLTYASTFINSFTPTLSGQDWVLTLTQSQLGSNELSGAETYLVEAVAQRRIKKYRAQMYVNHLGAWDSINRLRQAMEYAQITKLDE